MEILKFIVAILGATGFWKLLEVLMRLQLDKKMKKAEASSIYAQAGSQIIDNWVAWSQKLETRVKELEGNNQEMRLTIDKQRNRIGELEKLVANLKTYNQELTTKLELLKRSKDDRA